MSGVKVGDTVSVAPRGLGKGVVTFWCMNPNFVSGKVLEIYGGNGEFANVEVTPGGPYWSLWTETLTVVRTESFPRKIEFKDVQVGDLIRATRVAGEDSYVKTLRVVKRSPGNSTLVSDGGLEAVMLWQHETEGNRVNATIELLDRPTAVPKRQYAIGDVVSADDLFEVDTEVVVRYVDVRGLTRLAVIHVTPTDLVGWDHRTMFEIVYVEKEGSK